MSLSKPVANPAVLLDGRISIPPLERVLYLTRQPSSAVPMPVVSLSAEGPLRRSSNLSSDNGRPVEHLASGTLLPSEERLLEVMKILNPADGSAGFPVNATAYPPPMLPLGERLKLGKPRKPIYISEILADVTDVVGGEGSEEQVFSDQRTTVTPAETLKESLDNPLEQGFGDVLDDIQPTAHEQELYARAARRLTLDGDLFGSDTDSLPDLISVPSSSDTPDTDSPPAIDEACTICHRPRHAMFMECPLWDAVVAQINGSPSIIIDSGAPTHVLGNGRSVNNAELLATAELSETARYALARALGPDLTEWVSRVTTGLTLDAGEDGAQEVQVILDNWKADYERKMARREKESLTALEKEVVDALVAMPDSGPTEPGSIPDRQIARRTGGRPLHKRPIRQIIAPSLASEIQTPVFYRRGRVVDRPRWSSSSASDYSSSSELSDGSLSPLPLPSPSAVQTWLRSTSGPTTSPSSSHVDQVSIVSSNSKSSSDSRSEGEHQYGALPFTLLSPDEDGVALALYYWAYEGSEERKKMRQLEDKAGCDPADIALRTLHGRLRRYVDYTTMAAEAIADLRSYVPAPVFAAELSEDFTETSDAEPSFSRGPSSLDQSLPSSTRISPTNSNKGLAAATDDSNNEARSEAASAGEKRKAVEGGVFMGPRKRISTGFSVREATLLFAGIRMAILETGRRMEEIVWNSYGVTQASFPSKYVRHPLLFEFEAAKMQAVWYVLRSNGRTELADKLRELLAIRLRLDSEEREVINAASLDEGYPERFHCFRTILRDPNDPADQDMEDSSSDSSTSRMMDPYGSTEWRPKQQPKLTRNRKLMLARPTPRQLLLKSDLYATMRAAEFAPPTQPESAMTNTEILARPMLLLVQPSLWRNRNLYRCFEGWVVTFLFAALALIVHRVFQESWSPRMMTPESEVSTLMRHTVGLDTELVGG
ncbi:hypothetical protein B0H12DRAFT_1241241 [Mycena haematopus]|nr:hypothetical protein B0H12DRAFT_1241241 [Mycena haematopus]